MQKVNVELNGYPLAGIPIERAPCGAWCEIIEADHEPSFVGRICRMPHCTNEAVIIIGYDGAMTDLKKRITRVRPLNPGEKFTVTIL